MRLTRLSVVLVAALCPIVVGCGEKRSSQSTSGGQPPSTGSETAAKPSAKPLATVAVTESEFKLDPANPSVRKAGVVRFKVRNDGQVAHALEVEGPGGEVKTPIIQPGKSATLNVDLGKPGSYEWYCPVDDHKQQGMKGTIKVAGGGSGDTSTEDDSSGNGAGGGGGGY